MWCKWVGSVLSVCFFVRGRWRSLLGRTSKTRGLFEGRVSSSSWPALNQNGRKEKRAGQGSAEGLDDAIVGIILCCRGGSADGLKELTATEKTQGSRLHSSDLQMTLDQRD